MTAAVFVAPIGYPLGRAPRYCRLLTIGSERHATACLASIPADEPVLLTARRPSDDELCAACRADLAVREARGDDLTPWRGQIGAPALLTVERAAEELFGAVTCTGLTARWCPRCGDCACGGEDADLNSADCPLHSSASLHAEPAVSRTTTTDLPKLSAPVEQWDAWWAEERDEDDSLGDLRPEKP